MRGAGLFEHRTEVVSDDICSRKHSYGDEGNGNNKQFSIGKNNICFCEGKLASVRFLPPDRISDLTVLNDDNWIVLISTGIYNS